MTNLKFWNNILQLFEPSQMFNFFLESHKYLFIFEIDMAWFKFFSLDFEHNLK